MKLLPLPIAFIFASSFASSLLLSFSLFGQTDQFEKVDSIIEARIQCDDPGLGVGIVKEGAIIYERYRGLSNLQHQVPFSEKTRSNIASTAKQFTALMILELSLNHQLGLDDDVRKYLPNLYKEGRAPIKIRHLINHTSGIHEYVDLLSKQGPVWWKRVGLDNDDLLELLEAQRELEFEPGSAYQYSNSNYVVLAKIVETVTGTSFTEHSKLFFRNLGMHETSFVERYMEVIPNSANPYSDWGRGEWWETPTVTKTCGEGFLFTTLRDQLRYEQKLQSSDLNPLLKTSQEPILNSEIKTYGFGLKLQDRLQRKAVHHDGATYGYHSQTLRFPEEKLTVFIMSNNGNVRSDVMADQIARHLLSKGP